MKIENAQKAVELYKELTQWKSRFNEIEKLHSRIIEGSDLMIGLYSNSGTTKLPDDSRLPILTMAMSYYMQTIKDLEKQIEVL